MPDDDWVSALLLCDEAVMTLWERLRLECRDFAIAQGATDAAAENQVDLIYEELVRGLPDLILIGPVVTRGASELAVRVVFDPAAYRRIAEAAKDRVLAELDHRQSPVG